MDVKLIKAEMKDAQAIHIYAAAQSRDAKQGGLIELRKGQRFSVGVKYEGGEVWEGWYYCEAQSGSGWVPENVIEFDGAEGKAKDDYSSFELSIKKGEKLRGLKETGGWIWCENDKGERGWIPEECLKEIKQ